MSEERIVEALRALAESGHDREASPEVETRLRQAFRRRLAARRWKREGLLWATAGGTAAAAIAAGIVLFSGGRKSPVAAPSVSAQVQQAAPVVEPAPPVSRPVRRPARVRSAMPRELATDFFPLIDVALPFEHGEMVRVTVPAATMLTVGLPVPEERLADPIQADVLIGEEGLARAIRFVRLQQ
jgi:hypothetical protein